MVQMHCGHYFLYGRNIMGSVDLSNVSDDDLIAELHRRSKAVTIKSMETDMRFVAFKTWGKDDFIDIAIEENIPDDIFNDVVNNALKYGKGLEDYTYNDWDVIRYAIWMSQDEICANKN